MTKRDPFDRGELDKDREELEFQRQRRIERLRELVKSAMGTKDGREMFFALLDLCQLNAGSFSTNALSMAFAEGRRSVGLDLQRTMEPDLYLQMLKEQHGRRN